MQLTTPFRRPLALLALLATGLAGCAVNPVTGDREVSLMSPAQEAKLGAEAAAQVAKEIGLVGDPALSAYVQQLGQRLATHSRRPEVNFSFAVADMPEPNAFALPGGYIYVSRGLLALANSEAELANVIGHEIGHVDARHAAQRQTRATGVGIATVLGTILAGVVGGGDAARAASELGQAAGAGLIASYGRDQERQSDEIGQSISALSGWDPAAMSTFLAALERDSTRRAGGQKRRPGYLDSHPALDERVQVTAQRAAGLQVVPAAPVTATRADFLKRIDGLLVGDDPAKGTCRANTFAHIDFDFFLRFPEGWQCQNQAAAVIAAPQSRDALIRLELQGKGTDARAAAQQFAQRNQLSFEAGEDARIGGFPAYRALARAQTQQGQLGLDMTWIVHPTGIFRITGMAPVQRFNAVLKDLRSAGGTFRSLTAEEKKSATETRLRVVKAKAGETLATLSKRTGNAWSLEETSVVNDLNPAATLAAGQLVKIAKAEPYRRR
jgi:predicted Zn-dependent protease